MGNACGCCASPPAVTSPQKANNPYLDQSRVVSSDSHVCSSPIDSIVKSLSQNEDPAHQIEDLVKFMDFVLSRIKAQGEAASTPSSSSSGVSPESVASGTKAAAQFIDFVSSEADKLKSTEIIPKEIGSTGMDVLKVIGETHWVFVGLSLVAYALQRWETASSNVSECTELLEKLIDLSKDLIDFKEAVPEKREKVSKAICVIVEGAFICCDYIQKGSASRYFSAEVVQSQLQKIRDSIKDISDSLTRGGVVQLLRQKTLHYDQSSLTYLECQPEGIEDRVLKVKEMLDMEGSESAAAVILWGLGGVGKSTLAASVLQHLNLTSTKFSRVTIDEENTPWKSHVTELQQKIILHLGGQKYDIGDPLEGRKLVQKELENKSCLLYIDNVADRKYIWELLPKEILPGTENSKLRILITSRERILGVPGIKKIKDYNVKELPLEAARKLLSKTILQDEGKVHSHFDEARLMNEVAEACKGVPLLLSVFGNYLRGHREEGSYTAARKALQKGNPESFTDEGNVGEKLFFVYHHIKEKEKEAFLDICTYFYGFPWQQVHCIVGKSLETLKDKSLVKKSDWGAVIVHDILRLMGIKEAKQTRLKNYEEFSNIKDDASKLKTIKGIALFSVRSLITLESKHLNAMRESLRVLILGDWVRLEGPPSDRAFTNLRYLYVGDLTDFPFRDSTKLKKLRVLYNRSKAGMDLPQLPGTLRAVYHYLPPLDCKEFVKLPLQNLTRLERFKVATLKPVLLPQGLELPPSLKDLQLIDCKQSPKRFGHLTALENLFLDICDLGSLPRGFGQLDKLAFLSLAYCKNLITISEGLGTLSSLTCLQLQGCTRLEMLPADLGKLTTLQQLIMRDCENLRALPEDFGSLSSLQNLDLTGCIKLQRLPESFGSLSIQVLTLESLVSLEELPQSTGNLQNLMAFSLIACNSLRDLPSSFVRLRMLETLTIQDCLNLCILPKDFGKLRSLHAITLKDCPLLKELPQGFDELPALKVLDLRRCSSSLVTLPAKFGELTCLEELSLQGLFLSSLPDEFGNLKGLKFLRARCLYKLERLPQEFENLASLRKVNITRCRMLNGAAMDKIVKLQQCCYVNIAKSPRLEERWREMQQEEEKGLIAVRTPGSDVWNREKLRLRRMVLWHGQCIQLNKATKEFIEHSSVLADKDTTVAVIQIHLHQLHFLETFVKMAQDRASSGKLRIFYVTSVEGQRRNEDEEIREILSRLPEESYAIPSTDIRRVALIGYLFFDDDDFDGAYSKPGCFLADVKTDDKGHQIFVEEQHHVINEETFPSFRRVGDENKISDEIGEFINSIRGGGNQVFTRQTTGRSPNLGEESVFTMFTQTLKKNNIDHLIHSNQGMVGVDQLKGKVVAILGSDPNTPECVVLQKIYGYAQDKQLSLEVIWIPLSMNYGFGTYTRAVQGMPWATFADPTLVNINDRNPCLIVFDEDGCIANPDALALVMSWGVETYPFTERETDKFISDIQIKSSLEFLLSDMDLLDDSSVTVKKDTMNGKLIFIYAEPPGQKFQMKSKLEKLAQTYDNFEILYVGYLFMEEKDMERLEQIYKDATQKMQWLKLSFENMIKFWYRCKYFSCEQYLSDELQGSTLEKLVKHLYIENRWLVLLDKDGIVTAGGEEVVETMCTSKDESKDKVDIMMKEQWMESLKSGKCNEVMKIYFKDELSNYPGHPQHPLLLEHKDKERYCDECDGKISAFDTRLYTCNECRWDLCGKCWKLFAEKQVQQLSGITDGEAG